MLNYLVNQEDWVLLVRKLQSPDHHLEVLSNPASK